MSLVDMGAGIVVDDETGEVIEAPEGTGDRLRLVAFRTEWAMRQAKSWEAVVAAGKAAIMAAQTEKVARYNHIICSRRQSMRSQFERQRFAEWLTDEELSRDDALALAYAAKDFNPKDLGNHPHLAEAVAAHIVKVPTREFLVLDIVREEAPGG